MSTHTGHARILNLFQLQNSHNPLLNEKPHVKNVAIRLMAKLNWGRHNGIPKWCFQFSQREWAKELGLSLTRFHGALKRCYDLVFDRVREWCPYSKRFKTIIRLKAKFIKMLDPGWVDENPETLGAQARTDDDGGQSLEDQGFEPSSEDQNRTDPDAASLYKRGSKKKTTNPLPPKGDGDRIPKKEFIRKKRFETLKRRCRYVVERVANVIDELTPYNAHELLAHEDAEIIAAAFRNVGELKRQATQVDLDPKVFDPIGLLSYRMAHRLERYGLTIENSRVRRA
jgi:hypothetical protein